MVTADRERVSHAPDERCQTNAHCFSCNLDEPDRPGDFRVCGECCHIFRTAEDLVLAEKRLIAEMGLAGFDVTGMTGHDDPDLIHTCPLCTHSF